MAKKKTEYADKVKGLGWRPDRPSINDYPWRLSNASRAAQNATAGIPATSPDRRALGQNSAVRDQGNEGSCVGFSSTYGVYFLDKVDKDKRSPLRSPQQVYYDARLVDGAQFAAVDAGAYIRDAMDQLRRKGAALESAWPYTKRFSAKPSLSAYKSAATWKLGAHYRLDGIQQIMEAIAAGYAVVGGITCFSSMFTPAVDASGHIPMPVAGKDKEEGGHALYFDMYDQGQKLLRFENSWTKSWGDQGYGYLPFDYANDKNLSDDWWAMQVEDPATTPWAD